VQGRREHDDNPKAEATPSGSNAIHLHAVGKISSEILDHIVGDRRRKDGSRSASSWASGLWGGWRAKCETGWRLELKPAVETGVAQIEVIGALRIRKVCRLTGLDPPELRL
jgi:hypothetical protein